MLTRIALSIALLSCVACSKSSGRQTTPVRKVAREFVTCVGACAVGCVQQAVEKLNEPPEQTGIGTSPSESKE